jgi:integrase
LTKDEHKRFGGLAAEWLRVSKPTAGEGHKRRMKSIVENHLTPLARIPLKELRPANLQEIINQMAEKGFAEKTMREVKQIARQVTAFAIDNDMMFRDVFARVEVPAVEAEERDAVPREMVELITRTYRGHRMGLAAMIALYAGLRRGEILALRWPDVDLHSGEIMVERAMSYFGNVGKVKAPKTKMGNRAVPVPPPLLEALQWARKGASGLLICSSDKALPMTNQAYKVTWNSYLHFLNIASGGRNASRSRPKVQAIEPFGIHRLRHTYASMLYDAGIDPKSAQKFLGHADIETTLRIYTHLSKEREGRSIEALNAYIQANFGQCSD